VWGPKPITIVSCALSLVWEDNGAVRQNRKVNSSRTTMSSLSFTWLTVDIVSVGSAPRGTGAVAAQISAGTPTTAFDRHLWQWLIIIIIIIVYHYTHIRSFHSIHNSCHWSRCPIQAVCEELAGKVRHRGRGQLLTTPIWKRSLTCYQSLSAKQLLSSQNVKV